LSDSRLLAYVEHIEDCDYANIRTYNLQDGLYIGKTGLGPIAIKTGKTIICFETGGVDVNKELVKLTSVFSLNTNHYFYLTKTKYKYSFKNFMILLKMKTK
jgi:hypothetical protein